MKILMLNYEFPPLGGGGGVASFDIAKELTKRHKVDVITTHYKGLLFAEVVEDINVFRVPVLMRTHLFTASFLSMISYPPVSVLRGIKLFRQTKYDVINTHFTIPTGPAGLVLSKIFNTINILSLHGGDIYDPTKKLSPHKNPILNRVVKRVLDTADIIVAQSNDTKKRAEQYYGARNIKIIPLGLPKPVFNKVPRTKFGFTKDDVLIISVGRLIKRKNLECLLKAISQIKMSNIKLLLIGDGPERNNLRNLSHKLGIAQQVIFLGHISKEEKYQYLSISNIFVLPSLHEGFGVVFLEAMYCGLPVITTNSGGQVDFLKDNQTGFFIPAHSEALLARKILTLLKDKILISKISVYNKQYIKNFFIKKTAEEYEQLFYQAIGNSNA